MLGVLEFAVSGSGVFRPSVFVGPAYRILVQGRREIAGVGKASQNHGKGLVSGVWGFPFRVSFDFFDPDDESSPNCWRCKDNSLFGLMPFVCLFV